MHLDDLLRRIDANRARIYAARTPDSDPYRGIDDFLCVDATYASNALSGNELSLPETRTLLAEKLTPGGKSIWHSLEAIGHERAFHRMMHIALREPAMPWREAICDMHRQFYVAIDAESAGAYRDQPAYSPDMACEPPGPGQVPGYMGDLERELDLCADEMHPVLFAAYAHRRLLDIQPFVDGNGRIARLLMNLVLMRAGYTPAAISPVHRDAYLSALATAQRDVGRSEEPLQRLVAQGVLDSQRDCARLLGIGWDA